MKFILFLVGLALAGYAGYHFEPSLRPTLTGNSPAAPPSAPKDEPAPVPVIDFASLTPDQLPAEITLLSDVGFSDEATGIHMTLQSGAKAKLVRVVKDIVIIRIGTTEYVTSVPISKTDLVQRILNPGSAEIPAVQPGSTTPTPSPPVEPPPASEPTPVPEPVPTPEPEPTPAPTPAPTPEPVPTTLPQPETTPSPAPTPSSQPISDVNIVAIMRQSLANKEIKEFTVEQVKTWKAEPQEALEGSTFDVGTVVYEQETIFGLKTIIAKAYISNGKVERWIWPKSGLTIQ